MVVYTVPVEEHIVIDKIYFVEAVSEQDARRKAKQGKIRDFEELSPPRVVRRVVGQDRPGIASGPIGTATRRDDLRQELTAVAKANNDGDSGPDTVSGPGISRYGRISIDPRRLTVRLDGRLVSCTRSEFRIIRFLMQDPEQVFPRDRIMQMLIPDFRNHDQRTCDSHIKRIRKSFRKIDPDFDPVQTLYGMGYRLRRPDNCADHIVTVDSDEMESGSNSREMLIEGDFILDRISGRTLWKDQLLRLSPGEISILAPMIENPGIVYTRDFLLQGRHEPEGSKDERIIDTCIKRIRRKFKKVDPAFDRIESAWGVGYRFLPSEEKAC